MHNTHILKGIRCPRCFSEQAFIIQMTMNVVMQDDGAEFLGCSQPDNDHFPDRVIPGDSGFRDDDPIECFTRRSGCGHRGTVGEFRAARGFIADIRGRSFVVPGAHLDDAELADEVNLIVRAARAAGHPTWFDREITAGQAAGGIRTWAIVEPDREGNETIIWYTGPYHNDRVTEDTLGAQPVTVYEE